jgi:phage repressor protein C with HTH and peptisase S24 domain
MTTNERIKQVFKANGVSQYSFCNLVDIPVDTLKSTFKRNSEPGFLIIKGIAENFPNIDLSWLLTGKGEMIKGDTDESPSILPFELKGAIPYYSDLPVSAGNYGLLNIPQEESPTGYMSIPGVHAMALFPVIGCSMLPTIKPGDVIGINEINSWELVDPGKIYMIVTNEERMIKRLRIDNENDDILWCVSDNYKEFKILKENIRTIYHVVYHGELL